MLSKIRGIVVAGWRSQGFGASGVPSVNDSGEIGYLLTRSGILAIKNSFVRLFCRGCPAILSGLGQKTADVARLENRGRSGFRRTLLEPGKPRSWQKAMEQPDVLAPVRWEQAKA